MDLQKEKEELIEMFGVHFETLYHLPPLASRILGLIIVDGRTPGFTFESLVEITGASKSSVSTAVNLLLKLGKITYITVSGDRKKYYRPAPFSDRLDNYQRMLQFEKRLIERMLAYTEKTQHEYKYENIENIKAYQSHVLKVEELLQKTVERFRQIEEKNKKK
ncbi:hypothetical protein HUK80_10395 [Flavobacterium sp. MAH-1]|uniref:DNA-binding transcriptional regulator GbsR, MarR family n=1 Tax=Flavobacterium agri TaxID=2743471 RepID=A0A7Y8Y4W0_9FLAO|nr:hypothetical protein [Flavobacterium agri]NUY81306.1 hypothetical protein [Flavobacterium agri]NYA71330.1 hypothetical protein [Flavobacterium agri]